MATTKEQVLAAVSEYREANTRPCPARYLTDKFGDDVLDVIAALKKDGTLIGKRGRTGGLVPGSEVAGLSASSTSEDGESESVADQFAQLAAKLAADDGSVAADAATA